MDTFNELAICAGYGGFSLGLRLLGIPHRTVCYVEREAYAAATLVARMEDQTLRSAPIWNDLTTFDGKPWRGKVHIVTAGLPCQPFSAAGVKAGLDDERHLWPHAKRIIEEVKPELVFLENVTAVARVGWLAHVLSDLAEMGFDAEWGLLSAASVGAPHKRDRFWLLAHTNSVRCEDGGQQSSSGSSRVAWDVDRRSEDVADTESVGVFEGQRPEAGAERRIAGSSNSDRDVGDTEGEGLQGHQRCGPSGPTLTRPSIPSTTTQWPPRRSDTKGWEEWIANGGPEPGVRRVTDGRPKGLVDALHLGGNGLVPRVATEAFAILASRLGIARIEQRN